MSLPRTIHLIPILLCLALAASAQESLASDEPSPSPLERAHAHIDRLLDEGRIAEAEILVLKAMEREGYALAEASLRRMVEMHPNRPVYRALLGRCLLERRRFVEAEAALARALEAEPHRTAWRVALAQALHQQGRHRASLEHMTRAVAEEPRPHYRFARATAAWHARRLDEVEKEIQALLAERPEDPRAICWLGRLYTEMGRHDAAVPALASCIEHHPHATEERFLLGLERERTGDLPHAEAAYRHVLEEVPGHTAAQYRLGKLLLQRGHEKEGRRALERFASLARRDDHMDALRNTLRNDPFQLGPRLQLAELLLEAGRLKEAETEARAARAVAPDAPAVHELLQRIHAATKAGRSHAPAP